MSISELRKRTCCFTGHRQLPFFKRRAIYRQTEQIIRALILQHNVCFFGVGGAIGYDMLAATILLRMKKREFPHIKIILVYPFDGFTEGWSLWQQHMHRRLLPQYDKVVCASKTACRQAYLLRNRHLVDGSAYCISYCTQAHGGTAFTVQYAKSQGLTVYNTAERIGK